MWIDSLILRFLQANSFKLDKTLLAVKEHTNWKTTKLPIKVNDQIKEFLDKGYLYVHGRDHKFRPIIVFNVSLLDIKAFDCDLMIDALTFFLEFIIANLLLPGQIENWIFILDLNGMGLSTLPLNPLKKLLGYLQHNYRGRLYVMYIVNTPSTIYIPWKIAKKFIEESTVNKIFFHKKQTPDPLYAHTNKDQVEQKYGGTAPNIDKFWPPILPEKDVFLNTQERRQLISKEDYISLYENGRLSKYKVNMDLTTCPLPTVSTEFNQNVPQSGKNTVYVLSTHRGDLSRSVVNELTKKPTYEIVVKNTTTLTKLEQQLQAQTKATVGTRMVTRYTTGLETEGADYKEMMDEKYKEMLEANDIPEFTSRFLIAPKFGAKPRPKLG